MIEKVALICEEDDKLLFVRAHNKDKFYLPGGKIDLGETEAEALIREAREELTVTVCPDTIKRLGVLTAQADGKPEGEFVRTICFGAEFNGTPIPSSEIEEMAWLGEADSQLLSATGRLALALVAARKPDPTVIIQDL